jgi:hypothetical protein
MKNYEGKDDILRFIYDEMSPQESNDFQQQLNSDLEIREEHDEIKEVQHELDSLRCSPSPDLLKSIMRYAREGKPVDKQSVSKGIA